MAKRTKRPPSQTPRAPVAPITAAPVAAPVATTPAGRGPGLSGDRRIAWTSVSTVVSAAILIGAEVFGGAFAGGWALANLFELGQTAVWVFQGLFFAVGLVVMVAFLRHAQQVEPFFVRD